jgi:hypothetical protein
MNDPVEEIYRHRDKLTAKFNHDIHAMFEDMRKREGKSGHKVVSFAKDSAARAKPKPRRRRQPA